MMSKHKFMAVGNCAWRTWSRSLHTCRSRHMGDSDLNTPRCKASNWT